VPITTTVLSARIAAVFVAAPTPVITPQASSDAGSIATDESMTTTCD